jgi:hypothetical protein
LFYLIAADPNISVYYATNINLIQGGEVIAVGSKHGTQTAYASKESKAVQFDKDWSNSREAMLIKKSNFIFNLHGTLVNKNDLLPPRGGNVIHISLVLELNTSISNFGAAFWDLVSSHLDQNRFQIKDFGKLKLIDYSDRYLLTPLTTILLAKVFSSMPFELDSDNELIISTLKSKNNYYPQQRNLAKNWFVEEDENRIELIKNLLSDFGNVEVNLAEGTHQLPHSREINLEFETGKVLNLRLDQGMGYWKVNRWPFYPFDATVQEQLNWINTRSLELETVNSQRHPTYIDIIIEG